MATFYFIITLMILQGFLPSYGSSGESGSGEVSSGTDESGALGSGGDEYIEDESGMGSGSGAGSSSEADESGESGPGESGSGESGSGESGPGESGPGESGPGESGSGEVGSGKDDLGEPRVPSQKETDEAVQFSISRKNNFEWDFEKDESFKDKMASVTTDFCTDNRTRCALKDARRKRRSTIIDLYTSRQVHLLPGYPRNTSGSLQVAFYVQQPAGLFIGNISVLPGSTLEDIVITHKSALETAIGANISDVQVLFKPATPTTSPTAVPAEPSSNAWKWLVGGVGVGVGVVVVILILLNVFWRLKKKKPMGKSMQYDVNQEVIIMEPYNRSPRLVREDLWERPFYET